MGIVIKIWNKIILVSGRVVDVLGGSKEHAGPVIKLGNVGANATVNITIRTDHK